MSRRNKVPFPNSRDPLARRPSCQPTLTEAALRVRYTVRLKHEPTDSPFTDLLGVSARATQCYFFAFNTIQIRASLLLRGQSGRQGDCPKEDSWVSFTVIRRNDQLTIINTFVFAPKCLQIVSLYDLHHTLTLRVDTFVTSGNTPV